MSKSKKKVKINNNITDTGCPEKSTPFIIEFLVRVQLKGVIFSDTL